MRIPKNSPISIGLFDLDGTLLAWDCQILFRHLVLRHEPWRIVFFPIFLFFAPFAKLLGDECLKRIFLCYTWGLSGSRLQEFAKEFAQLMIPTVYPELLEKVAKHQEHGHLLILSSASPQLYVQHIGELLGFDLILGTEIPALGREFFPDLRNHKGENKVLALQNCLPSSYWQADGKLIHASGYTDSCADLPMLRLCDQVTVVNPKAKLTRLAETNQWEILRPARPWKSRYQQWILLAKHLFAIGNVVDQ